MPLRWLPPLGFTLSLQQLIQSAMDGFNVCIFAYGQTGSGKTFTIAGEADHPGITPRAFEQMFSTIEAERNKIEYEVEVYMLELYKDIFLDLLLDPSVQDRPKLDIHKDEMVRSMVMCTQLRAQSFGYGREWCISPTSKLGPPEVQRSCMKLWRTAFIIATPQPRT